jgi:hypothetical protein
MDKTPTAPTALTEAPTAPETMQTKYERENIERLSNLKTLYRAVASHLSGWAAFSESRNGNETLGIRNTTISGMGVHLKIEDGANRGKVLVTGEWPQDGPNGAYMPPSSVQENSPSIRVALARGPEAIAKEITKRFLPDYIRIWHLCKGKLDNNLAYEKRKLDNWARIAKKVYQPHERNGEPRASIRVGPSNVRGGRNLDLGYGDIYMESENSVRLDIWSLPVSIALAVLDLLASVNPQGVK